MSRRDAPAAPPQRPERWFNRTVAGAGLTSALADLCYETATVITPGLMAVLGIPAAALGAIEGIADSVASFTRMGAGFVADRLGHRKLLVLLGYALTPAGQALIALATGWPAVLAGRIVSWFGKGIRGPLRDAIVAQSVRPGTRGRAFGFHRATDTVGAVLGPLLGVVLLGWGQLRGQSDAAASFRFVLWVSAIPGVLAVLVFLTMVSDPDHAPNPALRLLGTLRGLPGRFKRYLGAVGIFGCGDFSHGLLILAATQLLARKLGVLQAAQAAGLLYVLRNAVQAAVSYPVGALSDRCGSLPVLVGGYLAGALTAGLTVVAFLTSSRSPLLLGAIFCAGGVYVAVQETLESTVTAEMVEAGTLTTSLGALGAVNGAARFVSSATVGALWTAVSPACGFGLAAALMGMGTLALAATARTQDR